MPENTKVIYHYCGMYQLDGHRTMYVDGLFSHATGIASDNDMRELRKFAANKTLCTDPDGMTILSLTRISG